VTLLEPARNSFKRFSEPALIAQRDSPISFGGDSMEGARTSLGAGSHATAAGASEQNWQTIVRDDDADATAPSPGRR
jgi:hypothetical protein